MRLAATLLFAFIILAAIAWARPPEYDEAYSIFLTTAHAHPNWPTGIFTPASVASLYRPGTSFSAIAQNLRKLDVHPPLYFWALALWRHIAPSWRAARLLSVMFALASLALVGSIAKSTKAPPIPAILICLLSYGFAYTSTTARGFALAQLLNLAGTAIAFAAFNRHNHTLKLCLISGLAFGSASFTNYLAVFTCPGIIAVIFLQHPKHAITIAIGFTLFLPADFYFFLAQRNARPGQFSQFQLPHALALLTKDQAAALFGGLPLYAGHFASLVSLAIAAFSFAMAWHLIKRPNPLFIPAAATPAGLLALGLIFNNTPIEIRYCAFGLPFIAVALAQALPKKLRNILIITQICAIIGLGIAPATMQPQGLAALQAAQLTNPQTLTLLPYGNDGVGIPGPFIAAAPKTMRILLIHGTQLPPLNAQPRIILITVAVDNNSKAAEAALQNLLQKTWHLQSQTPLCQLYTQRQPHQQP